MSDTATGGDAKMRKVRIGVVGCGRVALTHAIALKGLEEADLVSCCDTVPGRAQTFADEYEIPSAFASLQDMLANADLDAVTVCSPHPAHAEAVIASARAGIHSICEKPLATNLVDVDAMLEATQEAGVKFAAIFQRRFWPAAQRLRQAIDAGKLGRPILGDCVVKWHRSPEYYAMDPWRGSWAGEGGGVLTNQAVHAIDLLQWYMGPAETIFGHHANLSHGHAMEAEDNAVAVLRFGSGALGVIQASVSLQPALEARITVTGHNGATASVLEPREGAMGINDIWTIPGEWEEIRGLNRMDEGRSFYPHCHQWQLQDFLQAIREDREPAVTGREGRKAVEIVQAIYISERTGEPVQLPLAH
jgi:predicted dehydrogenase